MTDRHSLREFQQNLAERLSGAATAPAPRGLLAVESGSDRWLFDLADVGEVVPAPVLTTVPLTKPWYSGLANVRGNLYSVVDLCAFNGGEATARNSDCRLLLVGSRYGINSALLVSRVLGLRSHDALTPADAPAAQAAWRGEAMRDAQGNTWLRLSIPQLLKARDFLDVGLQ